MTCLFDTEVALREAVILDKCQRCLVFVPLEGDSDPTAHPGRKRTAPGLRAGCVVLLPGRLPGLSGPDQTILCVSGVWAARARVQPAGWEGH